MKCAQPRKNNDELDRGSLSNKSISLDSLVPPADKQLDRLEADVKLLGIKYSTSWTKISNFLETLEQQQSMMLSNLIVLSSSVKVNEAPDFDSLISAHLQPLIKSVESLVEQKRIRTAESNRLEEDGYLPPPGKEGFAQRLRVKATRPGWTNGVAKPRHVMQRSLAEEQSKQPIQHSLDLDVEPSYVSQVESSNNHNDLQRNLHLNDIKKAIHEEIKSAFSDVSVFDQKLLGPNDCDLLASIQALSSEARSSLAPEQVDMEVTNVDIDQVGQLPSRESTGPEASMGKAKSSRKPSKQSAGKSESMRGLRTLNSSATSDQLSMFPYDGRQFATFVKASADQSEGQYEVLDTFPVRADTIAFQAIHDGDINKVRRLLQKGLDPNSQLEMVIFGPKKYTHVSLLAAAVLMQNEHMVRLLLDHKASLQSPYGFVAGACHMHWFGSAMFACVPTEQLDILKLLAEHNANLHENSSNDANLIWQCAYFGATRMMSYLLSHDVEFDSPAASQNDEGVSHTPLLCAVIQGRIACANKLIEVGADVNSRNEVGVSPLQWAIRQCLPQVVQNLISNGARLEGRSTVFFGRCGSVHSEDSAIDKPHAESKSCLELLFQTGNPVVVAAAACGLENQERQVKALPKPAVFAFLSASSDARCAMMRALFRERKVCYRGDHNEMVVRNTAYIVKSKALPGNRLYYHPNVARIALSIDEIDSMFKHRVHPTEEMMEFLDNLAPQTKPNRRGLWSPERCVASIKTYECLVPGIHRDLELLKIISDADDLDAVFTLMHTQALVDSCWKDVRHLAMLEVFIHFAVLFLFLLIAESLPDMDHQTVRLCASIGIPIWILVFLRELSDIVAHGAHGWYMDYICHISNWVDIIRIAADIILWVEFISEGADFARSFYFRILFAGCCFMKWIKLLYCLTPFQFFGLKTMPILHAMRDIGPFCIILLIYIAGIAHAFIALGVNHSDARDNFIRAFLFSTIANFDISVELIDPQISNTNEKFIYQVVSMCGIFIVPVTLMNILIAALGTSYDTGVANMAQLYQARKSETSFGLLALQRMLGGIMQPQGSKQLWYSIEEPPENNATES